MKRISGKFNLLAKRQQGFTLIELLIVIVIIGILAGVLIAVIDPQAQQNRARDATVQATINKMALAVGGFRSAYGRSPDGYEFRSLIQGFVVGVGPANHCTAGNTICHFTMTTTSSAPSQHLRAYVTGVMRRSVLTSGISMPSLTVLTTVYLNTLVPHQKLNSVLT